MLLFGLEGSRDILLLYAMAYICIVAVCPFTLQPKQHAAVVGVSSRTALGASCMGCKSSVGCSGADSNDSGVCVTVPLGTVTLEQWFRAFGAVPAPRLWTHCSRLPTVLEPFRALSTVGQTARR